MPDERRYDGVKVVGADGALIEGHEAVTAHFEREEQLLDEHGLTITFQLFRADPAATTFSALRGPKLGQLRIDGGAVWGADTVAAVKALVRRSAPCDVRDDETMTFIFEHRRMRDDALFYADHLMLLPVWVQVVLHPGSAESLEAAIRRVSDA